MSKKRRKPPPRARPGSPAASSSASVPPAAPAAPVGGSAGNRGWMLALAAVTLLAGVLRLVALARVPTTPFYDAAVRSMAGSWHNFFYGAFDPQATASVDKPPFDLWLQVITVKLIGFSSTALKLPSALASTAAVPLLYDLVRRLAGRTAGLASAATLAVLPVAVVTARSDTMDSLMMALLVAVAWLLLRHAERRQLRWLLLAALVLGIDFNVKLFEALVPVPAFLCFLWMSSHGELLGVRLRRLAAATVVFVVVALSWLVAVSLTPRHDRPYPVGSTNGSVWNAVFVYNGTARITKAPRAASFDAGAKAKAKAGAGGTRAAGPTGPAGSSGSTGPTGTAGVSAGGASPKPASAGAASAGPASAGAASAGAASGGAASAGATTTGAAGSVHAATHRKPKAKAKSKAKKHKTARGSSAPAGPLRLFQRSLVDFGGLVGTVLFAGLVLGVLALLGSSTRLMRPPPDAGREERIRRAAIFALGIWLLTGIVLFSFSGRVHPRYLEAFTPAVAATLGVSVSVLGGRLRDLLSLYLLAGALGLSLLEALAAAGPGSVVRAGAVLGLMIGLVGSVLAYQELRRLPPAGEPGVPTGAPGVPGDSLAGRSWSRPPSVVAFALVAVLAFPFARDVGLIRDHSGVQAASPALPPRLVTALSVYLRDHQGGARYEFAATAPSIAAPLIIRDPRPILLLTTVDARPLVTLAELRAAIAARAVSYVVMHGSCPHPPYHLLPACSAAAKWVVANGQDVTAQLGDPSARTGVLYHVG